MSNELRTKISELPLCEDLSILDTLIGVGTDGVTYRVSKDSIGSNSNEDINGGVNEDTNGGVSEDINGGSGTEWIKFELYHGYNDVSYGQHAAYLDFHNWAHGEELHNAIKDGAIVHIAAGVMTQGVVTKELTFIDIPVIPSVHITSDESVVTCTAISQGVYRGNFFTAELGTGYNIAEESATAFIIIDLVDSEGREVTSGLHALFVYVEPKTF